MLDNESERLQALRIIRKSCTVCPQQFPNAFTHSLAAIAMCSHGPSKDQLHRACVATLCELCKVSISYFVNLIYIIYNMFYFFFVTNSFHLLFLEKFKIIMSPFST